ncbi:hypothetical protein AGMMS4952_27210 [Spirochaetia bacterium]|nr:hypothetical protein AGMMS4952_27210 [Spirochaetia bacterium]
MYPWLDFDLLHLRLRDEKTEPVPWGGYAAGRYTAHLVSGSNAAAGFKDRHLGTYTRTIVAGDETHPLIMDIVFDLEPDLPELPKVGITAQIPVKYSNITWFGKGPQESYPDRCTGTFLGLYEDTPASLEVGYIVPQENGNRMGVRYIGLSGKDNAALPVTILSEEPVHMSVSRYTQENLWQSLHTCDLVDLSAGDDGCYFLNIDCAQRGVGTATCGPDTLEQYRVRPGIFRMRLYVY